MLNLKKDFFEKYYYFLGHIIILKNFMNNKHFLKILDLGLFVKFYDVLGHSTITNSFGQIVILVNSITIANSNFIGNFHRTEAGS